MTDYNMLDGTRLQSVDNSPDEKWAKTKILYFFDEWSSANEFFSPTKISQKMISFDVFPLKLNLILFLGNFCLVYLTPLNHRFSKDIQFQKLKLEYISKL